jgi:hypothetical protein
LPLVSVVAFPPDGPAKSETLTPAAATPSIVTVPRMTAAVGVVGEGVVVVVSVGVGFGAADDASELWGEPAPIIARIANPNNTFDTCRNAEVPNPKGRVMPVRVRFCIEVHLSVGTTQGE